MNKKIKVIELLNKKSNGEEMPKRIKNSYGNVFEYDKVDEAYYEKGSEKCIYLSFELKELNTEVEILEDNTEEIEEIKGWGLATDYKDFETINHTLDRFGNKINELVRYVNKLNTKND